MKSTTKTIIGSLIAVGTVLQDPTVANMFVALAVTHPHIAVLAGVIVAIAAALHNPKVEEALEDDAPTKEESK